VQDFTAGQPARGDGWEYYSSNEGLIRTVDGRLRADDGKGNGIYSLNESILHLDLTDQSNVLLTLDHWNLKDESHSLPGTFVGHANGDGIAISADGSRWYTVAGPTASGRVVVDLDAAIATAGISYTSDFRVKFQQYDNYPSPDDGREWDNIRVEIVSASAAQAASSLASAAGESDPNALNSPAGSATAPDDHRDVNGNGDVTPLDVLSLINEINRYGSGPLLDRHYSGQLFVDVDSDGFLTPSDILTVIDFLNVQAAWRESPHGDATTDGETD
jgi:hypothetical protein